jgi:hypothetical protein
LFPFSKDAIFDINEDALNGWQNCRGKRKTKVVNRLLLYSRCKKVELALSFVKFSKQQV